METVKGLKHSFFLYVKVSEITDEKSECLIYFLKHEQYVDLCDFHALAFPARWVAVEFFCLVSATFPVQPRKPRWQLPQRKEE